ncbi:MAG TPA: DUF481 domain-containing protein, partial [Nevskiaceae bacterium]|nr:DUF481 domain-containing protein [Nevskiaceae bacterium]
FAQSVVPVVPAAASSVATPWAASASLGFMGVHGNTNSTALNFKGALGHVFGAWNDVLNGQSNYAKNDSTTSAQSWQVGNQLRYNLTSSDYLFGTLNYLNDRFAGIEERISEAVGYGRRIFTTPTQQLDLGVGVGANQQRAAGSHKLVTEPMAVFDAAYVWRISKNAQFSQTLHVEAGSKNTYINPVSELKLTIVGNLFATLDYELRYNTTVPAGTYHSDSITTVNIGYAFGKF